MSFPSANASQLLSDTLKFQVKILDESKKRKRETLSQPIRTQPPPSTTNSSSPNQNRTPVKNQSPTDSLPFLSSTMPYSPPSHGSMITPTDVSIIRSTWSRLMSCIPPKLFFNTVFSRNTSYQIYIVQDRPLLHTSVSFLPNQTTCFPLIILMIFREETRKNDVFCRNGSI